MCIPKRDQDDLDVISKYAEKVLSPTESHHFVSRYIPAYSRGLYNYYRVNRFTNVLRFMYYISNIISPVILITQNQTLFNLEDTLKIGLFWSGISLNILSTLALTLQDRWKLDQKSLLHRDFIQTLSNSFWSYISLTEDYTVYANHGEAYSRFSQTVETIINDNFRREQRLLSGNNRTLQSAQRQPDARQPEQFVNKRLPDTEAFPTASNAGPQ